MFILRQKLLDLIQSSPNLEHFKCWSTYPASLDPSLQGLACHDQLVNDNLQEEFHRTNVASLEKAFRIFGQSLNKADIAGILKAGKSNLPENYGLHPSLAKSMNELYKVSEHWYVLYILIFCFRSAKMYLKIATILQKAWRRIISWMMMFVLKWIGKKV